MEQTLILATEVDHAAEKHEPTPAQLAARARWLDALRSGKYKQGRDYLSRGDSHCCLGVSCVIEDVPSVEREITTAYKFSRYSDIEYITEPEYNWFAAKYGIPHEIVANFIGRATRLNDSGVPFAVIADCLELAFEYADKYGTEFNDLVCPLPSSYHALRDM